jgi:type IV pilus assembly protein PilM
MPDWKKEIKLSDLVPKRKPKDVGAKPLAQTKKKRSRKPPTLVGLKVGSSQLAAAVVANNGTPQVSKVAREALEEGLVVGGEVRDPVGLAVAIDGFFARHALPRKGVRLGLASTRIGVRAFDLSGIDDDRRLTNAIMFRAQETLPVPVADAVLDYQLLSDEVDEDGVRNARALLVVAYRELVEGHVAACNQAGVELSGIDLDGFALLRAVSAPGAEGETRPEGALVGLAIGRERSTLAVSDGRVCEFTRVLQWGGGALTSAISRGLELSAPEAERIKRAMTLDPEAPRVGPAPEREDEARQVVLRELESFARELVSSLRFYQGQPDSLPIAEVVLTGGTSELVGLAPELERLTGVTTSVADPFGRAGLARGAEAPEAPGSLTIAIGLGIED